MKDKTKQRFLRLIAFSPFFTFAPLTLFHEFFFWAFWVYFVLWVWLCAHIDRKDINPNMYWGGKALLRITGVIVLQFVIVFSVGCWIMRDLYDVRGADGKLKIEQYQHEPSSVQRPVIRLTFHSRVGSCLTFF